MKMRFKKMTSNQNFKMYPNNYIENYSRKYSERNYIINYNLSLIFRNQSCVNKNLYHEIISSIIFKFRNITTCPTAAHKLLKQTKDSY